jgi:hypothetical protein
VRLLIAAGADVNDRVGKISQVTPLKTTAGRHDGIAALLRAAGARE